MNPRESLYLEATVRCPGQGGGRSIRTRTRNISYEGALVEDKGFADLRGTIVRLEFEAAPDRIIGLDALVLRAGKEGLGLMFAYYSSHVFEQLDALLASEADRHRCGVNARSPFADA